jgi:hypothetical protein
MNDSAGTYFQELNQKEKISKLSNLVTGKHEITIWEKGDKSREKLSTVDFSRDRVELVLYAGAGTSKKNKDILFSFKLNGLSFFGKGKLKHLNGKQYALVVDEKLFKGERRSTFRLLTYPHHQVYIAIHIPEEEVSKSNVLSLNSKMSQTNLFKNFLQIINDDNNNSYREGYFPFRVIDVSVTGLAFQIGEFEASFFPEGRIVEQVFIDFNGEEVEIPKVEVVYNVSILHSNTQQRSNKIGLRFLDVDTNLDLKLGAMINGALRDVESEFEDFI